MGLLIPFLGFLFLFLASKADSEELYRWIDETGKVYIVDEITRVPESHRDRIKVYQIRSRPNEGLRTQTHVSPKPAPPISETQEQLEPPTLAAKENAAKAELLHQRKAELEEEITIAQAQGRRFGTIRRTFYKKKVEQAVEELKATQNELKALPLENQ